MKAKHIGFNVVAYGEQGNEVIPRTGTVTMAIPTTLCIVQTDSEENGVHRPGQSVELRRQAISALRDFCNELLGEAK